MTPPTLQRQIDESIEIDIDFAKESKHFWDGLICPSCEAGTIQNSECTECGQKVDGRAIQDCLPDF